MTPLLTAAEAYPAFERLFLEARTRVALSFRVFDPDTQLHSPQARQVGRDWFDLICHTLQRGVALDITISDFDPIVRPDYHRRATRALRGVLAAGEVSGRGDLLRARTALHPARVGWLTSLVLWPKARGYLLRTVVELNAMTPPARARALAEMPGLAPYLETGEAQVRLRRHKVPRLTPVTHHQKLAVADGASLYIGGLDLNDRRFDSAEHDRPADETWHDTQLLIHGPLAASAETHLRSFRAVARGATPPETPGLLRTISRARRRPALLMSPINVLRDIARAHDEQAAGARRLIYLETQYFRDTRLARHLARQARAHPDLGLILILPGAPDDVAFLGNKGRDARYGEYLQAKSIDLLRRAFGTRLFIGSPVQRRAVRDTDRSSLYGAPLIYLHAKVSIFDQQAAIVSSANLNGRSLNWDTEAGVLLQDPADVVAVQRRCVAHWWGQDVPEAFFDPATAVATWRDQARANIRLAPEARQGFIVPYASGPARRFGRNLPGIPEEMV